MSKKINISRRKVLGLGLASAGVMAFEAIAEPRGFGLISGLLSRFYKPKISQKDYEIVLKQIKDAGYEVNAEQSKYVPGSKTIIVNLPDEHTTHYQRRQRKQIKKLDEILAIDFMALEGLSGDVDIESMRELSQEVSDFANSFAIDTITRQDGTDYELRETDSPILRLQKLRVKWDEAFDWATNGFTKNKTFQDDLKEKNKRHGAHMELELALRRISTNLPRTTKQNQHFGYSNITDYLINKKFRKHNPRSSAPGIPYAVLETNTPKWGMESSEDDNKAIDLSNALTLHININRMEKGIVEIRDSYKEFCSAYKGIGTPTEQERFEGAKKATQEYVGCFTEYISRMKQHRKELLEQFSEETRNALLETKYNEEDATVEFTEAWNRLVLDQRSRSWIKNIKQYSGNQTGKDWSGVILVPNGKDHSASVYQSAIGNEVSIISLGDAPFWNPSDD